jgi:hypothetical protein
MEGSGKYSVDDKLSFPRVESRRNLTSRRSLITTILHQNDRAAALQNVASKSTLTMGGYVEQLLAPGPIFLLVVLSTMTLIFMRPWQY